MLDDVDATDGGGMISCRFFFGGERSSPEHAASPSESSPPFPGVCEVSSIMIGSGGRVFSFLSGCRSSFLSGMSSMSSSSAPDAGSISSSSSLS